MAEEPGTSTAPVSDHRPVPRGVLPRRFQTWLMAGLAVGILLIILITGQPEPTRTLGQSQPAPVAPNPARLRDYEDRLRAMGARQALEAQAVEPVFPPLRVSRNPSTRLRRTRSKPIENVESTKACSPAMSFSADGRKQSDRTPAAPLEFPQLKCRART